MLVSYARDECGNAWKSASKCPLLLSDFNQSKNVSTNFNKTPNIRFIYNHSCLLTALLNNNVSC